MSELAAPEQRIASCQALVRSLALQLSRRLPRHVELDDLIGYGQVGLAEAAREFDPTRGVRFATYAYYRIRGAMYDGLARMAWPGRTIRDRLRADQLSNDLLRLAAEDYELEEDPDWRSGWRWLRDISRSLAIVRLEALGGADADGEAALLDRRGEDPAEAAARRELAAKLWRLIDALPQDARRLMHAVYADGLTLQEAGRRIGVSKSWASRLHARTLRRLARALGQLNAG